MGLGGVLAHGPENIQGSGDVVDLGQHAAALIDHGEWRRGLFPVMDDGLGLEIPHHVADELVLAQVTDEAGQAAARDLFPGGHPVLESADRDEGLDVKFQFPSAFGEVVQDRHLMITCGQIHSRRPAQIAIPTQNQDFQFCCPPRDGLILLMSTLS